MSDHVFHQHGDIPDAANFAQAFGVAAKGSYIAEGFTFTPDYNELTLDVAAGVAAVARGDMDTSDPRIDPAETRSSTAHPVQTAAISGLSLDDSAVNHVYLDPNIGTNDSPNITANATGDAPTNQSLKLGEVDTTNDTKSEQWHLVAPDGTLTYPDQAAADEAITQLPAGTVVYDRAADQQVISDARLNGLTVNGTAAIDALEAESGAVESAPSDDTDVVRKVEADSKADLTGPDGVLQSSQVPDLSITQTFTVTDQAARLSLNVQEGDVAIQTDNDTTYIFTGDDPSVDSNWSTIQLDVLEAIDGSDITPSSVTTPSVETGQLSMNTVTLDPEDSPYTVADDDVLTVDIANNTAFFLSGTGRTGVAAFFISDFDRLAEGLLESRVTNQGGETTLDGTTGPDGQVNVSRAGNTLYVENRSGSELDIDIMTFSR